ncbi:hypothetical protein [Dictyobacter vulcani]|nr:hypothetical protein [Dictyobacter vulcani]
MQPSIIDGQDWQAPRIEGPLPALATNAVHNTDYEQVDPYTLTIIANFYFQAVVSNFFHWCYVMPRSNSMLYQN